MVLRAASLRCLSRQGRLSSLKRKLASMTVYETEAILLAWHVSDGPQGHWVKFKLPLAITDGHPFALFVKGPEHGQRFRMTFEAIGNDELPTGHAIVGSAPSPSLADAADSPAAAQDGGSTQQDTAFGPFRRDPVAPTPQAQARGAAEPAAKPKKRWDDYSPSQQAGMVCGWLEFSNWILSTGPVIRWDKDCVADTYAFDDAADYIRWYCGVSSRSELDTNPEAAKRWRELYGMFQADTQYGDRR